MTENKIIEEMAKIIEEAKATMWRSLRRDDTDPLWHSRGIAERLFYNYCRVEREGAVAPATKKKLLKEMSADVSKAWQQANQQALGTTRRPMSDRIAEELWEMYYRKFHDMCGIVSQARAELAGEFLKHIIDNHLMREENLYHFKLWVAKQFGVGVE